MEALRAIALGIVQGLTEFLPVSSSGHLVIAETFLGHLGQGIVFEIAVHVGTLFAIAVFYRRRILEILAGVLAGDAAEIGYAAKLALATLPAVAVGLGAKHEVESLFASPVVVGVGLLVTSAILTTTRWSVPAAQRATPTTAQAFWIGCAQAVAIVPGISRSGTTVAAALALGVAPLAAAEFSFLMGIAAIAGAAVLAIPDVGSASAEALRACAVGALAAFASGLAALGIFVRLLRSRRFYWFAGYTAVVGALFLAWTLAH